jgi:nucleotide-binding universal stress UspA family protein
MTRRFTRILVPFDFGAASEAALICAKEFALKFNAHLFLLHVLDDEVALSNAREQLESVLNRCERERFKVAIEVRVGTPADSISQFATENIVDLIVMGAHDRRGVKQAFARDIAERLVRTAPCLVLTARRNDRGIVVSAAGSEVFGPWALSEGPE